MRRSESWEGAEPSGGRELAEALGSGAREGVERAAERQKVCIQPLPCARARTRHEVRASARSQQTTAAIRLLRVRLLRFAPVSITHVAVEQDHRLAVH